MDRFFFIGSLAYTFCFYEVSYFLFLFILVLFVFLKKKKGVDLCEWGGGRDLGGDGGKEMHDYYILYEF